MTIKSLKKKIKYRLAYTGTKETDILFKRYFLDNFDKFSKTDLLLIKSFLDEFSDNEIYLLLTKKYKIPIKYKEIIKIINHEK